MDTTQLEQTRLIYVRAPPTRRELSYTNFDIMYISINSPRDKETIGRISEMKALRNAMSYSQKYLERGYRTIIDFARVI